MLYLIFISRYDGSGRKNVEAKKNGVQSWKTGQNNGTTDNEKMKDKMKQKQNDQW